MKRSFGAPQFNSSEPAASQSAPSSTPLNIPAKETELAKREGVLEERERLIEEKIKTLDDKLSQTDKVRKDLIEKLEKSARMSVEEAQKVLLENVEKGLAGEISKRIKEAEEEIKLKADEKAKQILADAMYHGVTDVLTEYTTSTVALADEEMKGRIIGKEGRNIKSFLTLSVWDNLSSKVFSFSS